MSNARYYFRKRIREIARLQKEIDTWLTLMVEWKTGYCHNRLLQEYMELTYSPTELVNLMAEKWDKFHESKHVLKAMDQIIGRMQTELNLVTRIFKAEWGKHVARKHHIPKDKTYGIQVSVQHIANSFGGMNIHNIIGNDGMSNINCMPHDDVFCIITRLQVDGKEIRDETLINSYRRISEIEEDDI